MLVKSHFKGGKSRRSKKAKKAKRRTKKGGMEKEAWQDALEKTQLEQATALSKKTLQEEDAAKKLQSEIEASQVRSAVLDSKKDTSKQPVVSKTTNRERIYQEAVAALRETRQLKDSPQFKKMPLTEQNKIEVKFTGLQDLIKTIQSTPPSPARRSTASRSAALSPRRAVSRVWSR